jgi:hypothetical protein
MMIHFKILNNLYISVMSDKELHKLRELAVQQMQYHLSREEAKPTLVTAGLLDQDYYPTPPFQELA